MYNTKLQCTYNFYDLSLNHIDPLDNSRLVDIEDCDELEDMSELMYQSNILNAFHLEEYNGDIIDAGIHDLYEKMKGNDILNECMQHLAKQFISDDLEIGFVVLFSYNFFYITHRCICDCLETGQASMQNLIQLKDAVFGRGIDGTILIGA